MRKTLAAITATLAGGILSTVPAWACGGLVAPDGDVHLDKATTFVAWHAGVEHYVTSFAYSGTAADVGWIVPLPAVPQSIQPAGRWTLQRLELEFNPPPVFALAAGEAPAAADQRKSIVVEQVQVEALDVTVLKGSGAQVVAWCEHNGFLLPPETHDHLLRYAHGTPVFMAAKYNASIAQRRGLLSGDGVPLLITMRTTQLWVPLEVLANDNAPVNADLFLLTDSPLHPATLPSILSLGVSTDLDGATGFQLVREESMPAFLHQQLASDRNMGWLPRTGWLSYLRLQAPSDQVTYDLAVGSDSAIRLASFGTAPSAAAGLSAASRGDVFPWPALAGALAALVAIAAYVVIASRFAMSTGSMSSAGVKPSTRPRK